MKAKVDLSIPARGIGGSWILKLPSATYAGVPENEFAMMTPADAVGINVPELRLVDLADVGGIPRDLSPSGGTALAIRRFDRMENGDRIHVEDFAQVFKAYPENKYGTASYKNLAQVILPEAGEVGIKEFVRRLVFNALIGNGDMHLKNWSLIYPDQRTAALAPAYDFLSTIAYVPDAEMALKVSRTKRFDEFSVDELTHLAAKTRLPENIVLATARETVELFREHWRKRSSLGLPEAMIRSINSHMETVPVASWQ